MGYSTTSPDLRPVTAALQDLKITVDELKAIVQPAPSDQVNPYIVQQNILPNGGFNGIAFDSVFPAQNSAIGVSFTADGSAIAGFTIFQHSSTNFTGSYDLEACLYSCDNNDLPAVLLSKSDILTTSNSSGLRPLSFVFSGTNKYQTIAGVRYCVIIQVVQNSASTSLFISMANSSTFSNVLVDTVTIMNSNFVGGIYPFVTIPGSVLFCQIFGV